MAITQVSGAHGSNGGLASQAVNGLNMTGVNFILVASAVDVTTSGFAVSDSINGAAYTNKTATTNVNVISRLSYLANASVSSNMNVTANGVAGGICVAGFAGVQTSPDPFDKEAGFTTTNNVDIINTSDFTPTNNNELVAHTVGLSGTVTGFTATGGGFTGTDFLNFSAGVNYGCSLGYIIQTTAATILASTVLDSWTTSRAYAHSAAAFIAGAAGATRGLFLPPNLNGLGAGGSFFGDRL